MRKEPTRFGSGSTFTLGDWVARRSEDAVAENLFKQIWDYVNLKLCGWSVQEEAVALADAYRSVRFDFVQPKIFALRSPCLVTVPPRRL